jgi:L-aspartate oxidase
MRDMEFVQFHPTALKVEGVAPFLISEAARGEGAYLIDGSSNRFVDELAPRDVVARAIYDRVIEGQTVSLDLRHLPSEKIRRRFPHIYSFCMDQGLDMTRQPLPVVPAAHYFMGGLHTDLHGSTSLRGLFAAGEAASTGVHGANRLASNSLLECVVYGKRAAAAMIADRTVLPSSQARGEPSLRVPKEPAAARNVIREAAWNGAGIVRNARGLEQTLKSLDDLESQWRAEATPSVAQLETANLLLVARLVGESALARLESRGAHFRADYPARNDRQFADHSWVRDGKKVSIGS